MDTQTIYEIFRACRLCGAGGGYKMPIIQSVVAVGYECTDVELRQKIRDCVQLEVAHDDKMPPLICELCVDKVNDFYEFLEMVRGVNRKTRARLGLPPLAQASTPQGGSDGDCILGVTEPIFVTDDTDEPPVATRAKETAVATRAKETPMPKREKRTEQTLAALAKTKKPTGIKKELEKLLKDVDTTVTISRPSRRGASPTSPATRARPKGDWSPQEPKKPDKPKPSTSRGPKASDWSSEAGDDQPLLVARGKRARETAGSRDGKKIKITIKLPEPSPPTSPPAKQKPQPGPRSARMGPKSKCHASNSPKASQDGHVTCDICHTSARNVQGLMSHMRCHTVTFTSPKQACDACREWFPTVDDAASHHRWHKTNGRAYRCRRCNGAFKLHAAFMQHIDNNCVPWPEVPDLKCPSCWGAYPTQPLLSAHKCPGEEGKPGGQCQYCKRTYSLSKNLKKHETNCSLKKKRDSEVTFASGKKKNAVKLSVEPKISPAIRKRLKPLQVRMQRCDSLMKRGKTRVNVANVPYDFGYDPKCRYPYRAKFRMAKIKSEPRAFTDKWASDGMVNIAPANQFYKEEDYVHWDSDFSSDDEGHKEPSSGKRVPDLSTLALKTLFSRRCLGRVPRKLRIAPEKRFKSRFNAKRNDDAVSDGAGNDGAGNEGTVKSKFNDDWDLDTVTRDVKRTTNDDFDSLFGGGADNDKKDGAVTTNGDDAVTNDGNDDGNETDASLDGETKKNDISLDRNTETSNLDGFDIETSTVINSSVVQNGNIAGVGRKGVVNGDLAGPEQRETVSVAAKVIESDGISDSVLLDGSGSIDDKSYLAKISEEFNFDA